MLRGAVLFTSAIMMFAIGSVAPASAGQVSGQQLLSMCTANLNGKGNALEAAECMGFIVGVADTFDCVEKNHGFTWNSTAAASQPQLVQVVVAWLNKHPAALNYEAHRVVGAALQKSFPCK